MLFIVRRSTSLRPSASSSPLSISSSSFSISDCTSTSALFRTRKYGTFHLFNSSSNSSSASVKRVAVMRTTMSKCRMPMDFTYVACGNFGVPTPGKSHSTHSGRKPVIRLRLTLTDAPSSSRTVHESLPRLDTTSPTLPVRPSSTGPRKITWSPTWIGSASGSDSSLRFRHGNKALLKARPPRTTLPSARRRSPADAARKVYI
mmetsp:Transcript_79113/g.219863  ORF Transcript_79113/g.219863 Transcript_79113/m.219863 type:complete len:203 (+) Transcript_79113:906-1514(+)